MIKAITRVELKEVLMNPKASGVKEPYFIISGEAGQKITVITPGTNGNEFNKTYGHFHSFPETEIYRIVYGQGVILMQRNSEDGEAKEVKVISLRSGMALEVPAGYGHCLINVGKTYLVAIDNSPDRPASYSTQEIKEKHGFAYYVVDKKGEVGFDLNPYYHLHPQISTL